MAPTDRDRRPPKAPAGPAARPGPADRSTNDEDDDRTDEERAADDALLACLERGWDRYDQGDLDGAGAAAAEALALAEDSPEAITLRGAASAAAGRHEEALADFARAIELDPEFVDPYLHAADLYIYPLGQPEEAVDLCDEALDVAEEEEEYLDALLLKAEAQLELGDEEAARETLADLPPTGLPDAAFELRAGRALVDAGDLDAAERHLKEALRLEPAMTDALHALGLLHEARGDHRKMVQAFLEVREADLTQPAPPWGITRERFEELAQQALAELPEQLRARLENVPILAADYPSVELVAEGSDPRMMGSFSGVPYPEKRTSGELPHLDCVFLYQRNIERACRAVAEVEEEIRRTLIHETGHFFGLSEEDLDELGLG